MAFNMKDAELINITLNTTVPTCNPRREFQLDTSDKRINVCTFQKQIRVDMRQFLNDRETIKGIYFNVREFISLSQIFPLVQQEVYRQLKDLSI